MIHVEELTKYYDNFCAVDHISLNIQKGEILGILGPNGAGKTTTLRMLTGYFPPTYGTIRVKDCSMETDSLKIKNMMGYLPESAPLYPSMLVFDYLEYVAVIRNLHGNARSARLKELAELCGLDQIMHRPIGELSKGLKQRVGLAHAMMSDPEILVLDEPTSGLDPNQIAEIRDIIRRIGKEKTVILSTHILSEAEATCDRIMILHRGKIVADGGTDAIRQSLGGGRRLNLKLAGADAGEVEKRLEAIAGVSRIRTTGGDMVDVQVDCEPGADPRPEIYRKIKETDWILMEFVLETQTLESIFRELTKEN